MTKEQFKSKVLILQNKLFRYAVSIVADRELARDIVQEVLMKLWDTREQLEGIQNLESWSIRITRNKALDKLRLSANKTVELKQAENHLGFYAAPDKVAEQKNLIDAVQRLLKKLPEKQREIFRLRDLMGYSNYEIEEMMELNATQVKVNLFRARKKIKSGLNQLINYGLENEKRTS